MTFDRPINRGKVGLVTLIDYENAGCRLQNYATQRIITGMGFECTTLVNRPCASADAREERPARPSLVRRLARRLLRSAEDRERAALKRLRSEKAARGRAFTRAHIRESDFTLYRDTPAAHLDSIYDHFVVGSDQVWNPRLRKLSEVDFLTFASRRKRIAFSASMGVSEIPGELRAFYSQRLRDFAHISVREEAAAEMVRALTGREVPVTLDPTMMLGVDDWTALATPHPEQPAGKYLLTYFLGPRSAACQELTHRCAARLGLDVVHLRDPASPAFYAAGPAEFLSLVKDARLVFTDSFHGVIFAVIFGVPFLNFSRIHGTVSSMGSRLDTLLSTLRLGHRKFREALSGADLDRLMEPDFEHVRPLLDARAAEGLAYLAHALGLPAAPAERRELALPAGR